jgi:caffeoyl-CoA O-methyltransferase
MNTPSIVSMPIVAQDSEDPREVFATGLARSAALPAALSNVLDRMEAAAKDEAIPVIGRLEGLILSLLTRLKGPTATRVLDIGTAIGYSAIWLAHSLPRGGRVTSIEIDPERAKRAIDYIDQAGLSDRVEVLIGDAFEIIPTLGEFDVIFQDVMKHLYFGQNPTLAVELLALCRRHLSEDGVMLIDNALCGGGVGIETAEPRNELIGVRNQNAALAADPGFASAILPIRDGLWIASRLADR